MAAAGGWRGVPEQALDREVTRSRYGDVVLDRHRASPASAEYCLVEVVDWVADVGESVRDFDRRLGALDRYAVARMRGDQSVPTASGLWLLRATRRNRSLVGEHRHFFRARFPGSGRAWLAALTGTAQGTTDTPAWFHPDHHRGAADVSPAAMFAGIENIGVTGSTGPRWFRPIRSWWA
jgi:hypothetical protein